MNIDKNQSITLFVGAGAVKNAWAPIIKAMQPEYFKQRLSVDGATSGLSRLVYNLRWFSNNPGDALDKCRKILENTKVGICEEIKIAQEKDEISVRDEFWNIIEQITLSDCKRLMIVSTNWDTVVEDAINTIPKIKEMFGNRKLFAAHLHGVYLDPTTIYLPTEMVEEPYRTDHERQILGSIHAAVMQATVIAQTIIFYGLSISPLDAELTQIVGACMNNDNIQSIKIMDPSHKIVAERINLLLQYPTKKTVHGYDPNNLHNLVDYSLQ
jgi:hypothetical protein